MKKILRNFSIEASDVELLNHAVEQSDAENASHWLRGVIRILAKQQGPYALADIQIAREK